MLELLSQAAVVSTIPSATRLKYLMKPFPWNPVRQALATPVNNQ
jgi:hypothetical protein